jgi:hypothetical protein
LVCSYGIKTGERKQSLLVATIIFWGIVEILLELINDRYSYYIKYMILPAYFSLGLVLFFRKTNIFRGVSAILLIMLYAIDHNRSAVLGLLLVLMVYSSLYNILSAKIVLNIAFISTILYTLISCFIEPDIEMQQSFNTGRAQIWNFWIKELFDSPLDLLLGFGSLNTEHLNAVVDFGNFSNGINWLEQFHSAFIATFVYGGIIKFGILTYIIYSLNTESIKDRFSLSLYYYALTMMSFNSMVPFFTPELNQFLFLMALLLPVKNFVKERH